jgi:alanine racemase
MKKYYRVQSEIDLDAIYNNVINLKKIIKEDTKFMAVLKADGYGHGAVAVAKTIDNLVDYYGVAIVEEAVEFRKAGIDKPILILGVTNKDQYEQVVKHNVTQTIFTYESAKLLNEECKKQDKNAKVHIKIDTGMGRIGLKDDEKSIKVIKKIAKLSNIDIEGIFTHFANADEKNKFRAHQQLFKFNAFLEHLKENGIDIPIKHMSNSAATIDIPESNMDMVRCGIATYGLYPSNEVNKENVDLTPAYSLRSRVTYVKEVPFGVGISYNSTYMTNKNTKVATIPVGYADGYARSLSSKGRVLINGQSAPIIGRVCMDQFMVDVTDIDSVKEGDIVTLVGRDGEEYISVEEIAALAGSFNYEFVYDIGKRVPRVYYRNNKKVGTFDYYECIDLALNLK